MDNEPLISAANAPIGDGRAGDYIVSPDPTAYLVYFEPLHFGF